MIDSRNRRLPWMCTTQICGRSLVPRSFASCSHVHYKEQQSFAEAVSELIGRVPGGDNVIEKLESLVHD